MTRKNRKKFDDTRPLPLEDQSEETDKIEEDDDLDEAQEEAYRDVGHFPDRDQLFGKDHERLPSAAANEPWERWSGDMEEQVKGNRDAHKDAVEELHDAEHIVDEGSENEGLGDLPEGKPIPPRTPIPRAPGPTKNAG